MLGLSPAVWEGGRSRLHVQLGGAGKEGGGEAAVVEGAWGIDLVGLRKAIVGGQEVPKEMHKALKGCPAAAAKVPISSPLLLSSLLSSRLSPLFMPACSFHEGVALLPVLLLVSED